MVRGPLVRDGLTGHGVRWLGGESQVSGRRVAEGGCDDQDGERRDAKSAADQDQIPSVARPLLLGRRLSLRLSELFDVVSVFAHARRLVAADAVHQYYQLLVGAAGWSGLVRRLLR